MEDSKAPVKNSMALSSPERLDDSGDDDRLDLPWVSRRIFVHRSSIFDIHQTEQGISRNPLSGFFHLAGIMFVFYIIAQNVLSLRTSGRVAGADNLWVIGDSVLEVVPALLAMVAFSYLAPFVQWLMYKGLPVSFVIFLRVIIQTVLFWGCCWFLWVREDWPISQVTFILLEMFCFSLKVHSYFDVNWYLHEDWLEAKRKGQEIPVKEHVYPHNITIKNWFYFLCFPTLVYTTRYPRTKKIRFWYFIEKLFSCLCAFSFMHILIAEKIQPIWTRPDLYDPVEAIVLLFVPVTVLYLATFYIIFEPILNGFAEITRYGDREYYQDWWNSTTWDEFARKWNKQVHVWAMCHCYLPLIQRRKLSKTMAGILTFFISSVMHEFALFMVFRFLRPWIFILQMAQVPLILMGGNLKGTFLGNVLFWFGIVFGPPLISILYTREYYLIKLGGLESGESYAKTILPLMMTLVAAGFMAAFIFSRQKPKSHVKITSPLVKNEDKKD